MRKHSIQIYLPLSPSPPEKTQYKNPGDRWVGEGERERDKARGGERKGLREGQREGQRGEGEGGREMEGDEEGRRII
jgi:hypothetical protein